MQPLDDHWRKEEPEEDEELTTTRVQTLDVHRRIEEQQGDEEGHHQQ